MSCSSLQGLTLYRPLLKTALMFSRQNSHLALPRKAWLGLVPLTHPQGEQCIPQALLQESNAPVVHNTQNLPQSTPGSCFPMGLTLWLWGCSSQAPVSYKPVQELIRKQIGITLFGKSSWPLLQKQHQTCSPVLLGSCSCVGRGRRVLPVSLGWDQSPRRDHPPGLRYKHLTRGNSVISCP